MDDIDRLNEIMAQLRDPQGGCPWDLEQTFSSLVPHTLEEAYEVAEAAEAGDPAALCDELGDLLFQVVFYARIAEEQGQFDLNDVANAVSTKLVRRHPHVFGDAHVADAAEQTREWERIKAAERSASDSRAASAGALAGVSSALPAMTRAAKLSRRAARVGFDWPDQRGIMDKIDEEAAELRQALSQPDNRKHIAHELGDLLFACVNMARSLDLDPEATLRAANRRFESRFGFVENHLATRGERIDASSTEELLRLWQLGKQQQAAT